MSEQSSLTGRYRVEFIPRDGGKGWVDEFENLVTVSGKADALDKYLAGSAYTAAWFVGLVDGGTTPTFANADTMASHAGWTENTGYSETTRVAPSWNAATTGSSSASKSTATVSFTVPGTQTIAGIFLGSNSAKAGTTGTLYSCGAFSGGSRTVAAGTLNVTYTANAS